MRSGARLLLMALGMSLLGCGRDAQVRADHVVLVTIDTLRADHLSAYGYPRPTSPFLERLRGESVLFMRAFASMPTTAPSHASMLTALHPIAHRVLKNGQVLDASFVTLAEMLRGHGFRTAAFASTNMHFKVGGLDQGFDTFDEPAGIGVYTRPADQTVERAIEWLHGLASGERAFLWVHVFDPHTPYDPHPEQRERLAFHATRDAEGYVRFLREQHHLDVDFLGGADAAVELLSEYDAEVLFVDDQLRRLDDALHERGLADHTLFIVTADHGEGLGNHRFLGHGKHLYNEHLRVPLLVRLPGRAPHAQAVGDVVQLVDLLPTVLELAAVPSAMPYPIHGTSLAPLLRPGSGAWAGAIAFAQRRDFAPENRPAADVDPAQANYEEGQAFALQDGRFKYILRTAGAHEFYDLAEDPYETHDRIAGGDAAVGALRGQLVELIARHGREGANVEPKSVDAETIERLKSLGYLQ